MRYGSVAGLDKPVSRLVQGTTMVSGADPDAEYALLDCALELGIDTFDTAHVYGGGANERAVGAWVNSRGVREKVVIIAKGAHHSVDRRRVTPWDITADIHDSLARFKFDYLDLYLLHRDDPDYPVEPIVDTLNEHARAGRLRAFGGSNWTAARIEEANAYAAASGQAGFAASSPHFSLAEQYAEPWPPGCVTITGQKGAAEREFYQKSQMPVFAWSSLGAGLFSGRFRRDNLDQFTEGAPALCVHCYCGETNFQRLERAGRLAAEKGVTASQIALAWLFKQPFNLFPLVGGCSPAEVRQNVEALDVTLSAAEAAWLNLETDER